mgnify:CR=1 FL=1
MSIQIYRLNASSYQDAAFFTKEKSKLESIEGVKYVSSIAEIQKDEPLILITNTHTKPTDIPPTLLENTVLIVHPNSGYENFEVDFLETIDFPIVLGNPIRSHPVAEYILGCIFQRFVSIPSQLHWSQDRSWDRKLLRDQSILIFGQGSVGNILVQTLGHLCRRIQVVDPYKEEQFFKSQKLENFEAKTLEGQNIVIFAQSLNKQNENFFSKELFSYLREDVLLVNAARGGLLDEDQLYTFLTNKPEAFAYIDTFTQEPYTPGYLSSLKNINKTSHIAGSHSQLNRDIINFEFHIINEFVGYYNKNSVEDFTKDYYSITLKSKIIEGNFI